MTYTVETRFNEKEIEQITNAQGDGRNYREETSRRVLNLQEEGIKEALIKLGWTPHKDKR